MLVLRSMNNVDLNGPYVIGTDYPPRALIHPCFPVIARTDRFSLYKPLSLIFLVGDNISLGAMLCNCLVILSLYTVHSDLAIEHADVEVFVQIQPLPTCSFWATRVSL